MAVVGSASDGLSALTLPALSGNLTKNSASGNSDLNPEPGLQKGSQLEEDEDGSFLLHHIHFLQQQQRGQQHCNGSSIQKDSISNGGSSSNGNCHGHANGNSNVGHDGPVDEADQLPPQHVVDAAVISDRIEDNLPSEEGLTSSHHVVDAGSIAGHIADNLPTPEDLTPLISEESHSIQALGFDGNPLLTGNCQDVNLSNVKTLANCPALDDGQNGTLTNGFHLPDATAASNAGTQKPFGTDSMLELQDLLSKLNPLAEEFVPPSLMASSGAALNTNNRRKKNNYGLGRRRGNSRVSRAQREECVRRTVYVSDIDQQVTEEQLAALFQTCGQVIDCRVCGDPNSVLRFAFVEFADEDEAKLALAISGTMLGYYPVRVLPSKTAIVPVNPTFLPHSENEREMCARTIYCTNIDKKVSQSEVKTFFESLCGEVARLRLLGDYQHSTRIAFVEFVMADSAMTALNCSGAILGSLPLRVSPSKTPVRSRSSRVPSVFDSRQNDV